MHGENLLWRWIQQLFRNARVPEGCRGQLLDKLLPKLSLDDLELDWNGGLFLVSLARSSHANEAFQSRAFPDISANGANYVVAVCEQTCCCGILFSLFVAQVDGAFTLVYGTSCSSPVVGAIFTMINDARLAIGKGTIGFINPTVNFDIAPRIDEKVLTISPLPSRFIPLSSPVHSTTLPKAAILAAIPPAFMQPWDGTLSLG